MYAELWHREAAPTVFWSTALLQNKLQKEEMPLTINSMAPTAAPTLPDLTTDVVEEIDQELSTPYSTVLWNDPVNLMDQVIHVLVRVLHISRAKAEAIMWEAHTKGRAVVFSGTAEEAEAKALLLLGWKLQATVEKAT
jgi:ATP-dependent Clp protease adaptor protein ClpS